MRFHFATVGVVAWFAAWVSAPCVRSADWPQWRGQNRDGKSGDTQLLQQWPAGGPPLVWKAVGLGLGYSGVSVVADRVFTMGDKGDASVLEALRVADGRPVWSAKVGKSGAPGWGGFAGPRCTPTVTNGLVLGLDQWGELVCVSAAEGKEQWRKSFEHDFGATRPEWGWSESPLVDEGQVIVTPGGPQGAIVALDLKTGAKRWQTPDFTDPAQYSSVIVAEIDGVRTYIQLTAAHVVGIAPKEGKVLWKATRKGETAVITTPIYSDHQVYVTSSYGVGCNLFKVLSNSGAFTAEQVYANKVLANHHGGVIYLGDKLYGHSEAKGWVCQDFKTGQMVWSEKEKLKKGCVSFADGKLICREEDSGILALIEASPTGYSEKGRFSQPERAKEKAWTPPTIAHGNLFVRDQDLLFCYNLKGS
jgi:outer membrane protein assembly factor BamB